MRTALLAALLLAGCVTQQSEGRLTAEQQAFYNLATADGFDKDRATLIALSPVARQLYLDDKKCRSYGAKPSSDAYVACRAQLETAAAKPVQPAPQTIVVQQPVPNYDPPPPITCLRTGAMTTCQ